MLSNEAILGLSNARQQIIILPTEKCNFRCVYCYEDFSVGKMSEETLISIEKMISRRAEQVQYLNIGWWRATSSSKNSRKNI